jgi:hypothetical protein
MTFPQKRIGLERQPPDEGISGFGCIGANNQHKDG